MNPCTRLRRNYLPGPRGQGVGAKQQFADAFALWLFLACELFRSQNSCQQGESCDRCVCGTRHRAYWLDAKAGLDRYWGEVVGCGLRWADPQRMAVDIFLTRNGKRVATAKHGAQPGGLPEIFARASRELPRCWKFHFPGQQNLPHNQCGPAACIV